MPDGLALDAAGNVYVACYASDEIWRISPAAPSSDIPGEGRGGGTSSASPHPNPPPEYREREQQQKQLLAWDHFAILLSRPTNIAFGGENFDEIFVANLGRQTITRAKIDVVGQKLANLFTTEHTENTETKTKQDHESSRIQRIRTNKN